MSLFQEGYEYFTKSTGSVGAAVRGGNYVRTIEEEISKFEKALNDELSGSGLAVDKAKGFAAEHWHAGTYNVNAALRGSANRAQVAVGDRGELGSPDIIGSAGDAGLKYCGTAKASAKEQAMSLFERYKKYESDAQRKGKNPISFDEYRQKKPFLEKDDPLYSSQLRIVPKEQLKEIETFLKQKIAEEGTKRPEQVKRYQDTLNMLQDRLKDSEGNESVPLSVKESEQIAQAAKEGNFEYGISIKELMNLDYIRNQAFQAGISAAAISIALKTAPEIVKGIRYLLETGEIDKEQLKEAGWVALSGGAEGFLRGMISASITIVCKAGLLGETMKAVSPVWVSGVVVFAMDAVKGGINVLAGNKNGQELGQEMAREAFSTVGAMAVGSTLNTVVPVAGYLVGSLLGSMLGSYMYHVVTKSTAIDDVVSHFQRQAKYLEQYAAVIFKIDLDAFQKLTHMFSSIVDNVCGAATEIELNLALRNAYTTLHISLPWGEHESLDAFMKDESAHLVFE